jgi:hypothetical protein
VLPFQTACWDDPEKLLWSQGFRLPVDPESQVVVVLTNAKDKDLLPMEEAAGDIFPLFGVNRFDVAPAVLGFFDFPVRIKR